MEDRQGRTMDMERSDFDPYRFQEKSLVNKVLDGFRKFVKYVFGSLWEALSSFAVVLGIAFLISYFLF